MTEKIANKKKTTKKPRSTGLDPRRGYEENWEMVTFLGFSWEEAKSYKGQERIFLLEKAEENKIQFLKRQKQEEEQRMAQERQMAAMQQQMQQQQMQQMPPPQNPYAQQPPQGIFPPPPQ